VLLFGSAYLRGGQFVAFSPVQWKVLREMLEACRRANDLVAMRWTSGSRQSKELAACIRYPVGYAYMSRQRCYQSFLYMVDDAEQMFRAEARSS
jgi:hypothetical protein